MDNNVIVIRQLPVIEEQLKKIKEEITQITGEALSLECTEDTVKAVKKARADLNKDFASYEARRKDVKAQILAPYEAFECAYRNCITDPFKIADRELATKITIVENGLKDEKRNALEEYFIEYRQSIGLSDDDAPFEKAAINVTLSSSIKSLKEQAKRYLDAKREDMAMIALQPEHAEILVEYRKTGNAAQAITIIAQRHAEIEAERQRAEERKAAADNMSAAAAKVEEAIAETAQNGVTAPQEALIAPVEETPAEVNIAVETAIEAAENVYEATFTVIATMAQLKALKEFLNNGGYIYE